MRNQSDDETGGLPYRRMARVDFHLHSYASNVTDYYASNSLAIPESYSDPIETHRVLKARGMELVTLTDHNSIDGVRVMLDAGLASSTPPPTPRRVLTSFLRASA